MHKSMIAAAGGALLLATGLASIAHADEPMLLNNAELDQATAGFDRLVRFTGANFSTVFRWNDNGVEPVVTFEPAESGLGGTTRATWSFAGSGGSFSTGRVSMQSQLIY